MRRAVVVLVLAGCADSVEDTAMFDVGPVPDAMVEGADVVGLRSGLTLEVPAMLGRGTTEEVVVGGLAPNEQVNVFFSTAGVGPGPCPASMGGQCFDIVGPVQPLGTPTAGADGIARLQVPIGANVPIGTSAGVQAVAIRGLGGAQTVTSNTVVTTVTRQRTDTYNHFPPSIDLLFVIDDSCSMADEQARLANSFSSLLPVLSGFSMDYHVGVVTTDMNARDERGRLREDNSGDRWIEPSDANQAVKFAQMAEVGTDGTTDEEGFGAMIASINDFGNTYNAGFRRDDAQYAVVVVSDENEHSTFISVDDAEAFLGNQETWNGDASFTSIVTPLAGCPTGDEPGDKYLGLTNRVGGAKGSICAANYAPTLLSMSQGWWTSEPFELTRAPLDPATMDVTLDGVSVDPADWVWDDEQGTVRFTHGFAPAPGSSVRVTYFW
ncbi:MAG: hypothetical protein KC621_23180 [Myxococcales bacterium]|nr:hypothetical protein [Myxococcales bacterium]